MGEPWGIPDWTGSMGPRMLSRHTAAWRLVRKLPTQCTNSRGILFWRSSCSSQLWLTKSKYPLMSKVRAEVTRLWFHAALILLVKDSIASVVLVFGGPPHWFPGIKWYFPARYLRQQATIFSRIFPRHSSKVIRR